MSCLLHLFAHKEFHTMFDVNYRNQKDAKGNPVPHEIHPTVATVQDAMALKDEFDVRGCGKVFVLQLRDAIIDEDITGDNVKPTDDHVRFTSKYGRKSVCEVLRYFRHADDGMGNDVPTMAELFNNNLTVNKRQQSFVCSLAQCKKINMQELDERVAKSIREGAGEPITTTATPRPKKAWGG